MARSVVSSALTRQRALSLYLADSDGGDRLRRVTPEAGRPEIAGWSGVLPHARQHGPASHRSADRPRVARAFDVSTRSAVIEIDRGGSDQPQMLELPGQSHSLRGFDPPGLIAECAVGLDRPVPVEELSLCPPEGPTIAPTR